MLAGQQNDPALIIISKLFCSFCGNFDLSHQILDKSNGIVEKMALYIERMCCL